MTTPTTDELAKILETLEAAVYRKTYYKLLFFKPYAKQKIFFDLGASHRERLLDAGTQLGKSDAGAYETSLHLTGDYPPDWEGRRFDHPVRCWMAGETSTLVRDVQQKKLCGEPGVEASLGTGMIPKDAFVDKPSLARGVTDAFDTIQVRHKSGGISVGRFKSYEQGRQKFQGESLDFVWFDEEPEEKIYSEGMARTTATGGMVFMTFTPLQGRSSVVLRFWDEQSDDRALVVMTIDDVVAEPHGHIKAADRDRIVAAYLPHEREARTLGIPLLGSGRIFTTPEAMITEAAIEHVPTFWVKLWGMDFGGASDTGHPFAAVLALYDRDNDVIHIHETIRMSGALSIVQAAAMKRVGADVPVAWPRDGRNTEAHSGKPLAAGYKVHGLHMLPDHATWPDGTIGTEAGVQEWDEREKTGRLKIASHLSEILDERRFYHRNEGKIIKVRDDLLSAGRVVLMMKRFARAVGLGSYAVARQGGGIAKGTDFNVFGGEAAW